MLPVHSSIHNKNITLSGIVSVEALINTIKVSQFGINLGLIVFDTFANDNLAVWHMVTLASTGKYLGLEKYDISLMKVMALLTNGIGLNSHLVSDIARDNQIIHFDIGKTVTPPSTKRLFWSAGYTLLSELEGIVAFLTEHNWNMVQLVCSATEESQNACDVIRKLLQDKRICVIKNHNFESTAEQTVANSIINEAISTGSRVVIVLTEEEDVSPFVDALGRKVEGITHATLLYVTYIQNCNNCKILLFHCTSTDNATESVRSKISFNGSNFTFHCIQ